MNDVDVRVDQIRNEILQHNNTKTMLDNSYWYFQDEILELLSICISQYQNDAYYFMLDLELDTFSKKETFLTSTNLIYDVLNDKDNRSNIVIICYMHNNHYAALYINCTGKIAIYNDSMGHEMPFELHEVLDQLNLTIHDLQKKQQEDSDNCGPFTIDNLSNLMLGHHIRDVTQVELQNKSVSLQLRQRNDEMLSTHSRRPYTKLTTDKNYLMHKSTQYLFRPKIDANKHPRAHTYSQDQLIRDTIDFSKVYNIMMLSIDIGRGSIVGNDVSDLKIFLYQGLTETFTIYQFKIMSDVFDHISSILILITMQTTKDDFSRELGLIDHVLQAIFSVFHFNYDAALSAEITNQRMLRNNKGMSYMKFLQMWSVFLKFIEPLLS